MNEINEYIHKLTLYSKMVKAGKIKQDPTILELMRDKIYIAQKNEDNKK